ncbi:MAG: DUF4159 domain-containing protein [Pseudomonadota bacterium]
MDFLRDGETLMGALAALTFSTPVLLWALLALPVLWILLRAIPPAPVVERFPAIALLMGLEDDDTTPANTPWWLLALRMLALAALIVGLAGPRIDPEARVSTADRLAVLVDASWASAQSWQAQRDTIETVVNAARSNGQLVALVDLSDAPNPNSLTFTTPENALAEIETLTPRAWRPDYNGWTEVFADINGFDTVWISDGLAHPDRSALTSQLADQGSVTVFEASLTPLGLSNPRLDAGALGVTVQRTEALGPQSVTLEAVGPDPAGITRVLSEVEVGFASDQTQLDVQFPLPTELRNRVERLQIAGVSSAGAVLLSDSSLKRKRVGLYSPSSDIETSALISPLHYLRNALIDSADTFETDLLRMISAGPDVVILADVAVFAASEREALETFVSEGGILVRFAGPRLAAAGPDAVAGDPLLPVQLRSGGRDVGGAMSWGSPQLLKDFPSDSPFFGLDIPEDVVVQSQVLAQPDPELSNRTLASLADGTPLVTSDRFGDGQVILFHVTANADWSNLPISVLFVQMLERLSILAALSTNAPEDLAGRLWTPSIVLDGYGAVQDGSAFSAVDGARFGSEPANADLRPGLYIEGTQALAFNTLNADEMLAPSVWPAGIDVRNFAGAAVQDFKPILLSLALVVLMIDILASLWLQGSLLPRRVARATAVLLGFMLVPIASEAQSNDPLYAANNTVLGYVLTGDDRQDRISEAGLIGLGAALSRRTSVEPVPPVGIDLARDPIELYSFLYWPITANQQELSPEVAARVNSYLRTGGMIMFDTLDANLGRASSSETLNGGALRRVAGSLAIPPLEPIPEDHVLTRTFYLVQDFPGRHFGASVWVEAAPPDAVRGEGMPFRNLNDGVSPVIIGGNDWAAAWAIDEQGNPLRPVGRGSAGELQREFAYRFGVNLIMYVLTGNYKSDQVHVPALLERLGN